MKGVMITRQIQCTAIAAKAMIMIGDDIEDGHEHDLVMPGFRFHPTEEELVEFYLRRKVEGKRFNVELINFLDLYRYDPWELPALAAIGEKEWFFYVPRDRKYRSGDRPNRVTKSGYWKATGADRMIRTESSRSIGLKKTLVFYSGKAPKGIRTSWIMNEYRLPQNETDRLQKAEISLCRVYKRAGVEDHRQVLPVARSSNPSCSKETGSDRKRSASHQPPSSFRTFAGNSSSMDQMEKLRGVVTSQDTIYSTSTASVAPSSSTTSTDDDATPMHQFKNSGSSSVPMCSLLTSINPPVMATTAIDELSSMVGYNPSYKHQLHLSQPQLLLNAMSVSLPNNSDKIWEWNPLQEAGRDYTSFK